MRPLPPLFPCLLAAALVTMGAMGCTPKNPARPTAAKIVIAHRGASGYLPEHTLEAKALAHRMGADFLEQDVVLTRDDVPVVLHDVHLDGVTDVATRFPGRAREDGRYYAADFDLEEIRRLEVIPRRDPRSEEIVYPKRVPPEGQIFRVPTLDEELAAVARMNEASGRTAGIYVEIKAPAWHRKEGKDVSRIVLELLARHGYPGAGRKIYLQCFDAAELERIKGELGSELELIQLVGDNAWGESATDFDELRTPAGLERVAGYAVGIGPWINQLFEFEADGEPRMTTLVDDAHAAGLEVHPYTLRADDLPPGVGSLEQLLELILDRAGADGVFTDFPDRALRFLNRPTTDAP